MFRIDRQTPDDDAAVEALLDRAFGPGRLEKTSYRFRQGVAAIPELSLVAHDGEAIVGTIRYWPALIGERLRGGVPVLLLGPLAVEPGRQGEGTGDALVRRSLRLARRAGHEVVFLVGDRGYYDRYGFEPAGKRGVVMPDEPKRLLVRELRLGALQGIRGVLCPWKG